MARSDRIRTQRLLREAEGYLELKLAQHALATLDRLDDPGTFRGAALYLRGESLRQLRRFGEALTPLEDAAEISPSNIQIWLCLGWCYKRAGKLTLAIEAMERALEVQPFQPLLHYNLACYCSLGSDRRRAIDSLATAIELDESFRDRVLDEPDFDALRSDPEFLSLTNMIV